VARAGHAAVSSCHRFFEDRVARHALPIHERPWHWISIQSQVIGAQLEDAAVRLTQLSTASRASCTVARALQQPALNNAVGGHNGVSKHHDGRLLRAVALHLRGSSQPHQLLLALLTSLLAVATNLTSLDLRCAGLATGAGSQLLSTVEWWMCLHGSDITLLDKCRAQ
jgi:hypothetical protein